MTMNRLSALALFCTITLLAPAAFSQGKAGDKPAKAQPASKETEKTAAIRKLLVLTGSGQLGIQVMNQMISSFKTSMPKVPEKFWQDFMKEVNTDELINMIVPIYDKHLSLQEVKDVIKFYETPSGKKLIQVLPNVTQESMEVGKQWGAAIGARVAKRLQEKGHGPQ